MADKPIEQDENLEISRKVNNESGMQKLFRAGVLALGFSVVGKKMGIKNNDLLKYTGVAAASMLMSDDDDRAGDLIAVGTVFGLSSGSKMLRSMAMENIDTYTKIYNRLESFDKTINNFNIGMMSLKDSVAKATKKTFDNNYDKIKSKQSEKELSSKINIASNFVKASINTITDGTKYLFTHSISETMDALTDSDLKRKYYMYYKDVDFKKIETSVNDFLKEVGVDIKHTDVGKIEQYGDEILSKISKAGFDTNMSAAESIKEFQKMKKIQLIENNTFFTDMLGMYSRLDKDSGKVVARYGQILKDNANTLDGMVRLADNFVSSLDKNTSAKYAEASAEVKEEMFLKYLRKKGFGEVIDKFYNKEDHIKIGDVNSLFENVTMEEVQNSEIKDFLSSATRNQMKNFVTYTRPTDYADEVETIEGIKHADILSNFSFTNVVTKSKFGVQDKTALDGTTTFLQTLGAIDRNVVSTFRSIFSTQERMWNTFSFINSRNRIKDVVANDILGFGYNKYGFIIDGKRITEEAEVINDNGIDIINMKYATNGKRNHRISYKRSILDVVNEDYKVAKENVRNESSIKDIIHTFKTKGVKQALSEFSYSAYNPLFGIRYDVGVGIRGASTNRGYYKDSKNILSIFNKKNPDDLKALNRKDGKIKNILTTLFGDYSDINIDRMRAESDKYEEVVNSFKKILVNRYINDGIENKDRTVFDDAFEFIDNKYKETILKNSKIKDKRAITLINDMFYYATELPDYNDIRQYLKGYTKEESLEVARVITDLVDANNALIYMKAKKINPENMEKLFSSKAFQSYMQSDNLGLYDQKYFDKILKTIKTSDEKKSYEELYNFVRGYQNVKREINRDIDTFFSNSTNVFKQSFKDASNNLDIKTNKNPFNPVYELIRGKRLNDHFNTFVQSKINDESSLIVNTLKTLEGTLDPSYSLTNLKKTIEELPKMFLDKKMQQGLNKVKKTIDKSLGVQEESVLKLKSFEYFNKIKSDIKENYGKADAETIQELHSKFGKTLNIGNMSFKDMIKIRDTLLYKNQGESVSSVIVEDSLKKGASVREILKNVKISIMRMISGNKFDIDRKKYASYTDELKNFKSKNFNRTDSTLSLGGKSIINNLQNSLEYIGVERLTNKELGDHFSQQVWNYTKKRIIPMFGVIGGAMAIDSASDALVPDDVPIIGNGISGVAATGIATARIGAQYALKYTGALSVMRMAENAMPGLISGAPLLGMLDPLMDPEEMIDVYFKGKAIRINDNRWWFSSGRQSAQGEEFEQYRPHFLYQMQHKSSGVYDNKIEKFFRRDFLLTKYPWYILDPYKEEREAYEKFGAVYPKTEQLFLDVPVIGGLLNATVGEVIKPTQYIGEEQWKVDDNTMLNPNYNPNDPSSPKYIHYTEPNKFISSFFEAVDDLATMSGLSGYMMQTTAKGLFGATNPYENEITLKSIDDDINYSKKFENLQLGGLNGTTEPIRRLLNGESLNTIDINPLRQNLPDWMPEFYKRGNNPYLSMSGGEYLMPGELFDDINYDIRNEDLLKLRTLSMLAPYSKEFDNAKERIMNSELSKKEQEHFYTSIGYANEYGKHNSVIDRSFAKNVKNIELTIDEKIAYNEFISNGVRYKLDSVTDDFNKLSNKYGANTATRLINKLNEQFQEGKTYSFQISQDATISGGIDRDGDYFKISSENIDKRLDLDRSAYNMPTFSEIIGKLNVIHNSSSQSAMPLGYEKRYGNKTAVNEWATEHVQSPGFRDWDNPISSFVLPFYTYSANSVTSTYFFREKADEMYYRTNATSNVLGGLVKLGVARNVVRKLTFGDAVTSNEYDNETELQDELEKIKLISGNKSYYNMTGNENLKQFESMVNEEDSKFLEELANTQKSSERNQILSHANDRLSNVLKTIWNRQQQHLTGETPYNINVEQPTEVIDIGYFDGNEDKARLMLQKSLNIGRSKLDDKRYGVISSYRGYASNNEAKYIQDRMYKRYGVQASVDSTIYSNGVINVNRRRE